MNVLLMGGSVFIGRFILEHLKKNGCEVTAVTRGIQSADWEGVTHIKSDRKDVDRIFKDLKGKNFDAVVDISGYTALDVNNIMTAVGARVSKYIFLSSAAVYDRKFSCMPFKENATLGGDEIWGEYGVDKFRAERALIDCQNDDLQKYIFRPPYVYGPNNNLPRESFLWARIVAGNPIFVPGNGETLLQFCYVNDLARIVGDALMTEKITPGTYNLGENTFYTINQYVRLLAKIAGRDVKVIPILSKIFKAREYFPFRENHLILDTCALKEIDSNVFTSLADGLAVTYKSMVQAHALKLELTAAEIELIAEQIR